MTAFVDVMIFLTIMMLAITISAEVFADAEEEDIGPDEILNSLRSIEVRLSDFTGLEDDSLLYLSDIMAYSASYESRLPEYLGELLDELFGHGRYLLSYTYGQDTVEIGGLQVNIGSESSISIPVSIGGSIYVVLRSI